MQNLYFNAANTFSYLRFTHFGAGVRTIVKSGVKIWNITGYNELKYEMFFLGTYIA